ncbi:MAG: amidohydrolase family protein, partial [Pyrinomonadaceae bacterium]
MSLGPARLAGLEGRKGLLSPGYDADMVVFDPEDRFVVNSNIIHHRHKLTPYDEMELFGVVKETFLAGTRVWHNGEFVGRPSGK